MKKQFDVCVIGGGPAGMMAAGTAAEMGKSVCLIDKNKMLGRKLRITGKGRCNITNSADITDFFDFIPRNSKFLYSALYGFTGADTVEFLEKHGVKCKTERGGRVFPVSDSAHDVAEAFSAYVRENGCTVLCERVLDILTDDENNVTGVKCGRENIKCKSVVIATGGMSYPLTGSTGDGYALAQKFGHSIIEPKAALVPMESKDTVCKELQGLTLKNVSVTMTNENGKELGQEFGEMLFAHFGLTGPVILSLSSSVPKMGKWTIAIDLKPALSEEQLDARILRDFAKYANKQLINALSELLPKKMIPAVIRKAGIDERKAVHDITKTERMALLNTLKRFEIECFALRPIEEAIITSGGVCVREVNPSTMESKKQKGLFFAGEVLDVDAYTGGFNLQIAYATGRLAGENA